MKSIPAPETLKQWHMGLLNSPARLAGEFHLIILRAHRMVKSESLETLEHGRVHETRIGKIRNPDEIEWWISGHEPAVEILRERTASALESANVLKRQSNELLRQHIVDYKKLIECLTDFSNKYQKELNSLLEFAIWLSAFDVHRPAILFGHRPWGSTRRSERDGGIPQIPHDALNPKLIGIATEIVFGLSTDGIFELYGASSRMLSELADSLNPEDYSSTPRPSAGAIYSNACKNILISFAEYFTFVRDSLVEVNRTAVLEMSKGNLRMNQDFWRALIKVATNKNVPESQFWDFKQTLSMWVGKSDKKHQFQRDFAVDIAAFANTFGGALIIGIENVQPWRVVGVTPSDDNLNQITGVLGRLTNLQPTSICTIPVIWEDGSAGRKIVYVVCIPQTKEAIYVKTADDSYIYETRGASGNEISTPDGIARNKADVGSINFDFMNLLNTWVNSGGVSDL